jgi:hypothetical protein
MSVLVRFGRRSAFLRAGIWVSADPQLETALNDHTTRWFQSGGLPATEKDQETAVAREAARQFSGRIALSLASSSKATARYFLSRRQLAFEFTEVPKRRRSAAQPRRTPAMA